MGRPGVPTTRYSNYVLQNADFLLIIGSRLNPVITAFDEPNFAPKAKKVIVDIDKGEIDKLNIPFELSVVADAADFIDKMEVKREYYKAVDRKSWHDYCARMKAKYPLTQEKQPADNEGFVNPYFFAERLSSFSKTEDVFVGSSSGRSCGVSHMAYHLKHGQRFVTSMGIGSMGWCIPSAIACCVASGKKRTLVIEGDGSLQHNIQELALINTYGLPIKIFVLSNHGYASIYSMQKNNFESRFNGCTLDSGLRFPSIRDTAQMYELSYYQISKDSEIEQALCEIMKDNEPCLCELEVSMNFDEIPKSITKVNSDGTFSSSKLEDLYPFVDKEEQKDNMPDWSII